MPDGGSLSSGNYKQLSFIHCPFGHRVLLVLEYSDRGSSVFESACSERVFSL